MDYELLSSRNYQSCTVDTTMGTLHYRCSGEGIPIVMLHGLFTSSATYNEFFATVPKGFKAIALDLPGFGDSKVSPGFTPSWPNFAEVVVAFADAMGISSFHMVGHSMGGGVAIKVASKYKHRIKKLVLVDAVGLPNDLPLKARLPTYPIIGPFAFRAYKRTMLNTYFEKNVFFDGTKVDPEKVDAHYRQIVDEREYRRRCLMVTTNPEPLSEDIGQVDCQVLTVWGEHDKLIRASLGKQLSSELKWAEFELIPNAGHTPLEEQTDHTSQVIWNFLQ